MTEAQEQEHFTWKEAPPLAIPAKSHISTTWACDSQQNAVQISHGTAHCHRAQVSEIVCHGALERRALRKHNHSAVESR